MIVGNETERAQIVNLLDEARRGRSGTLVVVGDPGIGKTAVLAEARRLAKGMRVLSVEGVESESGLPFAALHALLQPQSGEPDSLAVSAGTLSLLVEAAEEQALLVLVDDTH